MLLLAITLVLIWIDPSGPERVSWLRIAATLVLIEFLLLHCGVFMAVGPALFDRVWWRFLWFLGFGLVYAFSLVTFARWTGGSYILWVLLGVLLSRVITLVILRDKRGTILMLQRSAVGMVILLLTALICFLPLPPLGITEELRYQAFGVADDFLTEYPQRTLAWGVVYFLLMAMVEGARRLAYARLDGTAGGSDLEEIAEMTMSTESGPACSGFSTVSKTRVCSSSS